MTDPFDMFPSGSVTFTHAVIYNANPPNDDARDADHPVDPDDEDERCRTCDGAATERRDGWHHIVVDVTFIDLREGQ